MEYDLSHLIETETCVSLWEHGIARLVFPFEQPCCLLDHRSLSSNRLITECERLNISAIVAWNHSGHSTKAFGGPGDDSETRPDPAGLGDLYKPAKYASSEDGTHNFNVEKPPVSPLTGESIDSWYKAGETFTGVFQDIATSVDECRAECVGAYLMSENDLLALCGYTEDGPVKPADRTSDLTISLWSSADVHQSSTTCTSS